jgi:predicted O-methyltransferase YrrM
MTLEEITKLADKYKGEYVWGTEFEHRYDEVSSGILYSFIRDWKPSKVLEIGTWRGGVTSLIMQALIKNNKQFRFIASELLDNMRNETRENVFKRNHKKPTMIGDITKNLDKVPSGLDLLVIDTNHDLETTKWIVENIFPRCKKGALVAIHDWATYEENGKFITKHGTWDENLYLLSLYEKGKLGLEKLFWTYNNPEGNESSYWRYIG